MRHATATALLVAVLCGTARPADTVMQTERWPNTNEAFAEFGSRIASMTTRNLLARDSASAADSGNVPGPFVRYMLDGNAGERCGDGRAFVGKPGQPAVITFYLGEPKTITQVGVFTFNSDARTNQDYEVRFANNGAHPGKKPTFRPQADLTTGDRIIGSNTGGFHSYFVGKTGGALVPGKVDWVQFRIWGTYNVPAGSPAKKGNTADSFSTVIELEVLGEKDDVIVLTKEEIERREAIRKAPKRPGYEKKQTWQETMVAAREALLEWEVLQDRLAAPDSPVVFGPWHAIGPFSASSKSARQIEARGRIDLKKQYPGKDGKPLSWTERRDLHDGQMLDLAKTFGAVEGDVVYLCRSAIAKAKFDSRHPFSIGVGLRHGVLRFLPGSRSFGGRAASYGPTPDEAPWYLSMGPGTYQVFAKLQRAKQEPWTFWFHPHAPITQPGAGTLHSRVGRRRGLFGRMRADFPDPVSLEQIDWEETDGIWIVTGRSARGRPTPIPADWEPGDTRFLARRYRATIEKRLSELEKATAEEPPRRVGQIGPVIARLRKEAAGHDLTTLRRAYYSTATLQQILATEKRITSMRRAIKDQGATFGEVYPAKRYLARVSELQREADALLANVLASGEKALSSVLVFRAKFEKASREILLANPLLDFEKLLLVKRRGNLGLPANWQGNSSIGKTGYDNEIAVLSPLRPDGKITTLYRPKGREFVGDVDLHFDAGRMLFSSIGSHRRWQVFEIQTDGTGLRQVTRGDQPDVDSYDACYLPDGDIIFCSTANFIGVPCVYGSSHVAMLYRMKSDGTGVRQLCFEQDHDWCPCVLPNGRVLYLRWEYTDTPHSNTRLLFQMNPDGTGQMEFYGSNSYWPNSIFYARPIPGSSTQVAGIVTGHHGNRRMGELVIFDTNRGRREADGAVQRIPGYGKTVEPIIKDRLVDESWPKFLHPYPLSDKYFLTACKPTPKSSWGIYLADVFDNIQLVHEEQGCSLLEPVPLRKTETPPAIPGKVKPGEQYATVFMADVYAGNGLKGIPRGTVKQLRLFTYHFAYHGMGGLLGVIGMDGPWDIRRLLGTVPVEKDGSAKFRVPANTPISVQPLDADGKALQIMRSWMTAMPGETLSCVGCHEPLSASPPSHLTLAATRPASAIAPWYGPTRGFSYPREVQPVIDRYCVRCHNGEPREDGKQIPSLRGDVWITDFRLVTPGNGGSRGGKFSVGYANLHRYVRRPGIESDYHLLAPMEFHADTTELVQMLKKGHHNVTLDPEAWDRLIAWIDLNTPFHGTWHEHLKDPGEQRLRRRELRKLYAGMDEDPEEIIHVKYCPPPAEAAPAPKETPCFTAPLPTAKDWPFSADEARHRQAAAGAVTKRTIDLGNGITMDLVLIPAGEFVMGDPEGCIDERPLACVKVEKPFWMGRCEITNEQYALFDPLHDSAVESKNTYQFGIHGYPLRGPKQPVVRVSWRDAMAFCRWLSEKTGKAFTLPSEAEWEYACRAGTATPMAYGDLDTDFSALANMADAKLREFASNPYTVDTPLTNATKYDDWIPRETRFNDGGLVTVDVGTYTPNVWGLHDMHGNVWEWTLSTYRPYPYRADDGRNDGAVPGRKVVRGGSWRDRPKRCRSAFRLSYLPHQVIHDVGFRVVCPAD